MGGTAEAVLVVDDDPGVLRALTAMVAFHGYRPVPAGDADTAVSAYRRHGSALAAAVLDVQMPGTDGPATLNALRAAGFDRPVLFLTGSTGPYTADDLRARGAAAVLAKPPPLAALGEALSAAIAGTAIADRPAQPV